MRKKYVGVKPHLPIACLTRRGDSQGDLAVQGADRVESLVVVEQVGEIEDSAQDVVAELLGAPGGEGAVRGRRGLGGGGAR